MRDVEGDYRRAYIEEYEAYRRSGREEEAATVAAILRDHYGYDVDAEADGEVETDGDPDPEMPLTEHTAADALPETAVDPAPARKATARRAAAKKTAAAEPS